jgi:hypothetical protein
LHRLKWGEEPSEKPRRGRWSQSEVAILRDLYGLRDEQAIARELRRSAESVRRMAASLFRMAERRGPWTVQEVQDLKRYLGVATHEVIARILGRDPAEVRQQIFELGRIQQNGRWTREETNRFKRIYGTRSDEDLAAIFGRSPEAVQRHAEKLRLAKDKVFLRKVKGSGMTRMPRWSAQELDQLAQIYPKTANLEIAQKLGRSVKSVVSKAHHLGLKKEPERLAEMGRENVSLRYVGKR